MRVSELVPGTLIEPIDGYAWLEVPWTGSSGELIGNYLQAVSVRAKTDDLYLRNESVLYLGTIDGTTSHATPGKQVVLAWGKKMTIDPQSWRYIHLKYC